VWGAEKGQNKLAWGAKRRLLEKRNRNCVGVQKKSRTKTEKEKKKKTGDSVPPSLPKDFLFPLLSLPLVPRVRPLGALLCPSSNYTHRLITHIDKSDEGKCRKRALVFCSLLRSSNSGRSSGNNLPPTAPSSTKPEARHSTWPRRRRSSCRTLLIVYVNRRES